MFDALSILSRRDCLFTDGNLAADANPEQQVGKLQQLPFQLIYHDSWFAQSDRSTIIYHRNAEVLIPQRLELRSVRMILCRSQAEYDTLLNLLPLGVRNRWANKIGIVPELNLFHNKWTFVQQVELSNSAILFRFNPNTETPGPFDARVEIYERLAEGGSNRYTWSNAQFLASDVLDLDLSNLRNPQEYSVSLYLDGHIAFEGRYQGYDLPF